MAQEPPSPIPADSQSPTPEAAEPVDNIKQAEKVKEQGNTAFKAGKFVEAIEHYGRAIGAYASPRAMHTSLTAADPRCPTSCRTELQ